MDETGIELKGWWSYLIRGLLALALGVLLLVWTDSTLKSLILGFGIFAVVFGLFIVFWAIYLATRKENFALLLVQGLVSVLVGALLLANQNTRTFTLEVVLVFIAVWAVVLGFVELIHAFEMEPGTGRGPSASAARY
jgi:uncharacterized membrane protein HdeD (DUF308 family)